MTKRTQNTTTKEHVKRISANTIGDLMCFMWISRSSFTCDSRRVAHENTNGDKSYSVDHS